jgi:hypothetical protein
LCSRVIVRASRRRNSGSGAASISRVQAGASWCALGEHFDKGSRHRKHRRVLRSRRRHNAKSRMLSQPILHENSSATSAAQLRTKAEFVGASHDDVEILCGEPRVKTEHHGAAA